MNVLDGIEDDELAAALAACNDESAHHILWADHLGEVRIAPLPPGMSPTEFQKSQPTMRVRWETWQQGNGYCGLLASQDDHYLDITRRMILFFWDIAKNNFPSVYYAG